MLPRLAFKELRPHPIRMYPSICHSSHLTDEKAEPRDLPTRGHAGPGCQPACLPPRPSPLCKAPPNPVEGALGRVSMQLPKGQFCSCVAFCEEGMREKGPKPRVPRVCHQNPARSDPDSHPRHTVCSSSFGRHHAMEGTIHPK